MSIACRGRRKQEIKDQRQASETRHSEFIQPEGASSLRRWGQRLLLFLCSVGSAHFRVHSVGRIFMEELAGDVRPKLLEDPAQRSLGGNDHSVLNRLAP